MSRKTTVIDTCDRCGVKEDVSNNSGLKEIFSVSYETGNWFDGMYGKTCGKEKFNYDLCKNCRELIINMIKKEIEEKG